MSSLSVVVSLNPTMSMLLLWPMFSSADDFQSANLTIASTPDMTFHMHAGGGRVGDQAVDGHGAGRDESMPQRRFR